MEEEAAVPLGTELIGTRPLAPTDREQLVVVGVGAVMLMVVQGPVVVVVVQRVGLPAVAV